MNEVQQLARIRRDERRTTATHEDAKRLAEVEASAVATLDNVSEKIVTLKSQGDFTDQAIAKQLATLSDAWKSQRSELSRTIIDPIEERTNKIDTGSRVIERSPMHVEASSHYAALTIDKKLEAIARAITGSDDLLAEALLTGREPLADETILSLQKRITPTDVQAKRSERDDMLARVRQTRITLNEITQQISGVGS